MKKIKIVDGWKIRNSLDVDFCMIGDKISYAYIPENEIWLEKIYLPEKKKILADFFRKRKLMKKFGYKKTRLMMTKSLPKPKGVEFRKKSLGQKGTIKISLVKGALVRKFLDPFFTLGGHWLVYDYVPKNEVWIDDALLTKEVKYVLIHELYEANLMKKSKNYDNAHDYAHAAEREARRRWAKAIFDTDEA